MSRSEFIRRAAEGMTVVLRGIAALLFGRQSKLRGVGEAAACGAVLGDRTVVAAWLFGAADQRSVVEQRVVEAGVRAGGAGELVEVEPDLPAAHVLAAEDSFDEAS